MNRAQEGPKRIVVCADGTWNEPRQQCNGVPCPTNVVKLAQAVLSQNHEGRQQIVLYKAGVGSRGGWWDHFTGGAFGLGISQNISELYQSLIEHYNPGDEIWLFGFSRGAYTVRSLAAFIRNCGILRPEFGDRYEDAYAFYRDRSRDSHPSSQQAKAFRSAFSWPDFDIAFIGVWDTVGALGIPVIPLRFWSKSFYEFHDVELTSHVGYAYQALAIDERRRPFRPSLWVKQPDSPASQVLEQAWFPGVHSDVGGGYPDGALANGPLLWIWDRAEKVGLALDPKQKPRAHPEGPIHNSMRGFYHLLGDGTRSLGSGGDLAFESLSEQAWMRTERVTGYDPLNLQVFLASEPLLSKP